MIIHRLRLALLLGLLVWAGTFSEIAEAAPTAGDALTPGAVIFKEPVSRARWIWREKRPVNRTTGFFRHRFILSEEVKQAEIFGIFDDQGRLWCNGEQIAMERAVENRKILPAWRMDLSRALRKGENVIAVRDFNDAVFAGFILNGKIVLASGREVHLYSDAGWKCSHQENNGWTAPEFDDRYWAASVEFGDALASAWKGRVANAPDFMMTDQEKKFYREKLEESARVDVSGLPRVAAKVVRRGEISGIEVNGELQAPFWHVISYPWESRSSDMVAKSFRNGMKFQMLGFSTAVLMSRPDCYDFSSVDLDVRRQLAMAPEALMILRLRFDPLTWWMDRHPDELVDYPVPGPFGTDQTKKYRAPSFASELWRQEMKKCLTAFIAYVDRCSWGKRVAGINVSYGIYTEWHYFGMFESMPDTGKAMTRRFRRFLKNRYGNDRGLQKAWHHSQVSLKNAAVPGAEERNARFFLRHPAEGKDRRTMDFYECLQKVVAETLLGLTTTAKNLHPDWLIGAYYGYVWGMHFPSEGQTILLDKVLSSPSVDFLQSPYCYDLNRWLGGDGLMRAVPRTFRRYGKLSIMEADVRTHLASIPVPERASKTPLESRVLYQRDFAQAMMNGCGLDVLQFGGMAGHGKNWLDDPEILGTFADSAKIFRKLSLCPPEDAPAEVAVVVNPADIVRNGPPRRPTAMHNALTTESMHALLRAGAPVDVFLLSDFLKEEHPYRCVVFLNLFSPSESEREAVLKKVRRPGVTAVWIYAPGLVTDESFSESAMAKLTGLNLHCELVSREMKAVWIDGSQLRVLSYRKPVSAGPVISGGVNDARIEARYADGRPAMLSRRFRQGYTSVWSGIPLHDSRVWRDIFTRSGVHCHVPVGTVFHRRGNLLLVHTARKAEIPLRLEKRYARVEELYSGEILGTDTDRLILKSSGPATWWMELLPEK